MFGENDVNKLESIVQPILEHLRPVLSQLNPLKQQCLPLFSSSITEQKNISTDQGLLSNDLTISLFTTDNREWPLLENLAHLIQNLLDTWLPHLSKPIVLFLKDFFYRFYYDFDCRSFIKPLTASILHLFFRELNGLMLFVKAFRDIFDGRLDGVIQLITHYPIFKDRSGPLLTTMLYTAVKTASIHIVKYLIEKAKCCINAPNRRTDSNEDALSSTAGCTALHAAASIGDKGLVAYLIEHGADISVKNQAGQTPIMLGMAHDNLKQYFQDCLISDYSIQRNSMNFQTTVVANGHCSRRDSIWEYMRIDFSSTVCQPWHPFPTEIAAQLEHASFDFSRIDNNVYFTYSTDLYSVDIRTFLLTQIFPMGSDAQNMAWVRCRDGGLLSSDRHPVWQILFVAHYECDHIEHMQPTLEFENLSGIVTREQRTLHLHQWYFCDTTTNLLMNDAVNCRRKRICTDAVSVGSSLTFDLSEFTFTNAANNIFGYIRWLPSYSANSSMLDRRITRDEDDQL